MLRVNKAKDEFIGIASHQLRTPATVVKQYLGILLSEMAGPLSAGQRKFLETANSSNERQLKLINDMLKTAQIDADAYTLHRSLQNLGQVLKTVIGAEQPTIDQRQQQIKFIDESHGKKVNIDPIEMDQVFSNLLDNASKYSPHNTVIKVTIKKFADSLEVAIADKGVGIDPGDTSKIFDKFTRINNELSATVSGSGLGLYWVKQIVEMHGGSIIVNSKVGIGSIFKVRLPL